MDREAVKCIAAAIVKSGIQDLYNTNKYLRVEALDFLTSEWCGDLVYLITETTDAVESVLTGSERTRLYKLLAWYTKEKVIDRGNYGIRSRQRKRDISMEAEKIAGGGLTTFKPRRSSRVSAC